MIVLAWFCLVGFIILVGFATLAVTFHHWYKQKKLTRHGNAEQLAPHPNLSR